MSCTELLVTRASLESSTNPMATLVLLQTYPQEQPNEGGKGTSRREVEVVTSEVGSRLGCSEMELDVHS